jgi:nicotinamide riboside transporter PnuC
MNDITWLLTSISLLGSFFNIKKKVACFYIWAIGEVFWMILDINNHVYGRAFLDFTSLCFALWGIYEWQFISKKNKVGGADE